MIKDEASEQRIDEASECTSDFWMSVMDGGVCLFYIDDTKENAVSILQYSGMVC